MGKYYAGIGSRETPLNRRGEVHGIAKRLRHLGYTLRSGGANGADTFFEEGAEGDKEIFLPWKMFNNRAVDECFQSPTQGAIALAEEKIKGYRSRTRAVRLLLARNMHQVLGLNLDSPVEFVICWTRDGDATGGTGHAIRLARSLNIQVFNLFRPSEAESLLTRLNQGVLF